METEFFIVASFVYSVSSYRTYEEWKLTLGLYLTQLLQIVLTVPMRNGNEIQPLSGTKTTKFLPYLWGMETLFCQTKLER